MKICIDPGHHVSVNGKRSPQVPPGIIEWEFDMSVSMCLESLLIEAGHDAFRTMQISEPENKPISTRRAMANGCDLFVSVHANAAAESGWSSANGFVVFYKPTGESLAVSIAAAYEKSIPKIIPRFGGIKSGLTLGVIPSGIPGVLIECGFMTNKEEAAFLATPIGQQRIARAIADGVIAYIERIKK
jgi:N-acetylmuramoyl-L-alanine amidase